MRFFSTIATLAVAAGVVCAQEAARFGSVDVSPSQVKNGDAIKVTYNATTARWPIQFVDFYIQGKFSETRNTPSYLLQRNTFDGAGGQKLLTVDTTVPPVSDLGATDWLVWAEVTYPYADKLIERGGISAPIGISA